ncbi:MAG: T9SS type A sorting domain-containing protein [Flavobacteriales bacterium]|nr:T9SS type A sorting domain-containing protein [Flavobacteriales bacterium]
MGVYNNTGASGEEVTVTFSHDPLFSFISGSAGAVVSAGQVEWSIPVIGPFEHRLLYVQVQVPPDPLLLGYQHFFTVSTISNAFEPNLANNTYTAHRSLCPAMTPTTRWARRYPPAAQQYFLDEDHWIDYAIRFQNTGSDTAFTVVIRDEIEADLDIESLQILGASHAFTPSFGEARELVFTFNGINLPDSTTDLLGSQGFVAFRMRARAGLLPGDAIENTAAIYFDFNEPMMTEPSVLVAEFSTDVRAMPEADIHISPNPTTDLLNLRFQPNTSGPIMVIASDGRAVNVPVRITVSGAQIDARALSSGVYQVRVADRSARFIKQ